jgi:hypothetical protein
VSPENLFIPEFSYFLADGLKFRPTGADALSSLVHELLATHGEKEFTDSIYQNKAEIV